MIHHSHTAPSGEPAPRSKQPRPLRRLPWPHIARIASLRRDRGARTAQGGRTNAVQQQAIGQTRGAKPYTTGISHFVCEHTEKMRIPSEKYFSDGVPLEKYPHKYNDRKIQLFYVFAVRNNFSVGVTRTKKLYSPRLKLNFFVC